MLDKQEEKAAKQKALRLLTMRNYSSHDLAKKLMEKFSPEAAEAAVAKMWEYGYLDDEKYARRLTESYVRTKHYGSYRIRHELHNHGIERELVEEILGQYDSEDYREGIEAFVRSKYLDQLDDRKGRQRVIGALVRRGHDYGDIYAVIRELTENDDLEDLDNQLEE